jgi:hypothetical protein
MKSWTRTKACISVRDQATHGAISSTVMTTMIDETLSLCPVQATRSRTALWVPLERLCRYLRTCGHRPKNLGLRIIYNSQFSTMASSTNNKSIRRITTSSILRRTRILICRRRLLEPDGLLRVRPTLIHHRSIATARHHHKNHILKTSLYL